ncbi:MAG: hypothetical protein ACTSPY_14965 [Candidatus Helarchaeota archaeon]
MDKKIIVKKLDHTGHSTISISESNIFPYLDEEFNNGNFIYSPDLKLVFRSYIEIMENIDKINELIIIPPVIGG